MKSQSRLSIGIPFPRAIPDPSSPSDCGCSDANLPFPERADMPTTTSDKNFASQVRKSLRWPSASATSNRFGSSTLFRVPTTSSITTSSTFQRTRDLSLRGGDAISEHQNGRLHPPSHHEQPMGNTGNNPRRARSVLQIFTKSLSKKRSVSLRSPSSPSLPTTPDFATAAFPSISVVTDTGPFHERRVSQGHSMRSHVVGALPSDSMLVVGKRRDSTLSPAAPQSSNIMRSVKKQDAPFDAAAELTLPGLQSAQNLHVFDQDGVAVRFGDLWKGQRTCVIFIRHFRCPFCMDYTRSIVEQVDPDVLHKAHVRLVLISNGSPAMIKSYISLFKFPFQMYTDPSLAVYRELGMTLRTLDGGPETERGQYIGHGKAAGIAMVLKNVVKGRIPVHKPGGDIKQLGGEFVLGPGLRCSYASRMHNTRSHSPILDVLAAAGVNLDPDPILDLQPQAFADEEQWMKEREAELKRMRARRGLRRGFTIERLSSGSEDSETDRFAAKTWRGDDDGGLYNES